MSADAPPKFPPRTSPLPPSARPKPANKAATAKPAAPAPVASQLAPVKAARVLHHHPCSGWFFIHTSPQGHKVLHRIAMWAELSDGRLVGLEGVRRKPDIVDGLAVPPGLSLIPAYEGCYVHESDLSQAEKEVLEKYRAGGL